MVLIASEKKRLIALVIYPLVSILYTHTCTAIRHSIHNPNFLLIYTREMCTWFDIEIQLHWCYQCYSVVRLVWEKKIKPLHTNKNVHTFYCGKEIANLNRKQIFSRPICCIYVCLFVSVCVCFFLRKKNQNIMLTGCHKHSMFIWSGEIGWI